MGVLNTHTGAHHSLKSVPWSNPFLHNRLLSSKCIFKTANELDKILLFTANEFPKSRFSKQNASTYIKRLF